MSVSSLVLIRTEWRDTNLFLSVNKNPTTNRRDPPHHQCTDPGTDSLGRSHLRINCATSQRIRVRDRTTRSPDPVRGTTLPSTPPSPHWREEVYPKAESLKVIYFFSFSTSSLSQLGVPVPRSTPIDTVRVKDKTYDKWKLKTRHYVTFI
jgi:hypothetical protein